MIRVGHVVTGLWDGGIDRVVLQIATGLPSDRFETIVYALLEENPGRRIFEAAGIQVRTYQAKNRGRSASTILANATALAALARDLRRDRIEVVNTHDFYPGVLGRAAAIAARIPRVYTTLHNTYSWLDGRHGVLNRFLSEATDAVIGVSQACVDDSLPRDRISEDRYIVIPNGVDERRYHPRPHARAKLLAELGWPTDTFLVGNVGTISPRKDQITLLRAVSRIADRVPELRVVLFGSERAHEIETSRELHAFAARPELRDRVKFAGTRDDLEEVLPGFDLFCMPSVVEGFGIALVEAMMSGVGVVVSDIPAFREVLSAPGSVCEAGLLHPVGDDGALAAILVRLARDPGQLGRLAAAGRTRAHHWSLSTTIQAYTRLFGRSPCDRETPTS